MSIKQHSGTIEENLPATLSETVSEPDFREGKAGFIDDASFFHIRRCLGVGEVKFRELFQVLTGLGECRAWYNPPECVARLETPAGYQNALRNTGFKVSLASTEGSEDDALICKRIQEINPRHVRELILLSANVKDFLPNLYEKARAGVEVYVVATDIVDPQSNSRIMSGDILQILRNEHHFHFVELLPYRDRIMSKPWIQRERRPGQGTEGVVVDEKQITITPEITSSDRIVTITFKIGAEDYNAALVRSIFFTIGNFCANHPQVRFDMGLGEEKT